MLNQPPTSSPYTTITPLSSSNSATLLPINMLPSSIQQQSPQQQQYSSPIFMNYPMYKGISPNPVDGVLHLEEGASLPSIGILHPNRTLLTDNNKACSKKKSDKTTTTLKQEDNIKRTMRGVVVLDQNSTMTTANGGGSMFNEKMKENTFDWKIQQQNGNNYTLLIPTTTGIKVQESSPQVQLNFNMNPYSSSVVSNNNGQTVQQQQQFNSNGNNNNSRVVRNTTSQLSQSQKLPSISEWFKDGNVVCRPSQQMTTATQPGINSAQQPQQNQPQQQQIQSPPPSQPTHVHRNQESTQPSQVIQSKSLWKFHQQQIPSMALDSQNNRINNIVVPTTTCENSNNNTMSDHNINTGASTTKASLSENMQVGVTVDEKKKVKRGKAPVRIDTMSNKVNPSMYTNSNNIATSSCMDTSNDFQTVNTTTITEPTHATSKSDPNIVLVIENVDSIKQYIAEKEQAQQQYASSSNHSRRISAKEVWNSIAAAAVETKSLIENKIKKQHKMRTMSPLSIGSPSLTQAIFEKLTLDDSSAAGNMTQTNHNTLSPAYNGKQQQLQTQYLNNSDTTLNSHNNGGGRLGRNEFVDFSKGEHEIQRKTRGEKVYKFKMIKF